MIGVLNKSEINYAILAMATRISQFENDKLCFISILKGGNYTTHRLLSFFPFEDTIIGYLGLSSYRNGTKTKEKIDLTYALDLSDVELRGKNVWLVDDIFDSGLTLTYAKRIIKEKGGYNSLRAAVLVRKMKPGVKLWNSKDDLPDVVGFEYSSNGFLVGSGMGKGEKYRCLDGLYELEPAEIKE